METRGCVPRIFYANGAENKRPLIVPSLEMSFAKSRREPYKLRHPPSADETANATYALIEQRDGGLTYSKDFLYAFQHVEVAVVGVNLGYFQPIHL